jgi:hypothetical protein
LSRSEIANTYRPEEKAGRLFTPACFSLAFAARGAMLTVSPFNLTFFGATGTTGDLNRAAHRCSKRL